MSTRASTRKERTDHCSYIDDAIGVGTFVLGHTLDPTLLNIVLSGDPLHFRYPGVALCELISIDEVRIYIDLDDRGFFVVRFKVFLVGHAGVGVGSQGGGERPLTGKISHGEHG